MCDFWHSRHISPFVNARESGIHALNPARSAGKNQVLELWESKILNKNLDENLPKSSTKASILVADVSILVADVSIRVADVSIRVADVSIRVADVSILIR